MADPPSDPGNGNQAVGTDIVDSPLDPSIQEFVALWRSWRTDGLLPGRNDFDVFEVRPWIGRILMMDVIDGGRDFRYRLVGTELVEVLRRDLSGRLVSECDYGGHSANVLDSFRRPVETRGPVFRRGKVVWKTDQQWRGYESVHCPLASDGRTIDMTIGVQVYQVPDTDMRVAATSWLGAVH